VEESMTQDRLMEYREIIIADEDNGLVNAAETYHIDIGKARTFNKDEALYFWRNFVRVMLESEKYFSVALFLWGNVKFTPEPQCVKDIWRNIQEHRTLLILGAGKTSKSYSSGVWLYLDWIRDPFNTSIRIISSSASHAMTNLFAHILDLHKSSCVPMEGKIYTNRIAIDEEDKRNVIMLTTIPMKSDGKGTLRGVAPMPRKHPHVKFGNMTRIRIMMDECEFIPEGVWVDIDNLLLPAWDEEHIKIIAASNPTDRNSAFGLRCKPEGGWFPIGTKHEWRTEMGFNALHLDGARLENVVQKKMIYFGLQTYEGYMRLISESGEQSATASTMARGWFPEKGMTTNAIPQNIIERSKGTYKFVGVVEFAFSCDLALEGKDNAKSTIGKVGMAEGWTNQYGDYIAFKEQMKVLQVETQFDMEKQDTIDMANAIIDCLKNFSIPSNRSIFDRTGSGAGVVDVIKRIYGNDLHSVHYSESATKMKIMAEDEKVPDDLYEGIDTELYFAARKLMEFDYVKFGQGLWKSGRLFHQLSTRQYDNKKGKTKLEPKHLYKSRSGGSSPDDSDSFTLLVHLARTVMGISGKMTNTSSEITKKRKQGLKPFKSIVDKQNYMVIN
jgi:hypothetical protein